MKNPFTWLGFAAVLCWSFCGPLVRTAVERMPLLTFAALLQGLSFLVLCAWTLARRQSLAAALRPSRRKLVVASLYLAYSLLTNLLIRRADGHETVLVLLLLINLWPAVALAFGAAMFRDRLGAWFGIGVLFTLAGGFLLIGEGSISLTPFLAGLARQPFVIGGALVAACTWALCSNFMKKWPEEGEEFMVFNMGLAAIVLTLMSAPGVAHHVATLDFPPVLLAVAGFNAAGFLCWEIGLRKGSAPTVITAAYFIPVLTALASVWYFHLPLTITLLIAAVCVTAGALISRRSVQAAA
ncbi:MAG: EamA family transporter [Burkholderiales bacterium]|nr:EamA family transporter [Opitutaceae bacterium]